MFATKPLLVINRRLMFGYTSSEKTVYCDSYDCMDGYKLIDDADEVEWHDRKCDECQCCKPEPVCSNYKCPKSYDAKRGSDEITCHYSGCTTDECCYYHL